MGSVQPIPDYIEFRWGTCLFPNGRIGFGYGWYVELPQQANRGTKS